MQQKTMWADRGQMLALEPAEGVESASACICLSRMGGVQASSAAFTVWMQLRGSGWVEAKEGRFRLRRGDWIAFEKDSRPLVQMDRHGLCIALALDGEALRALARLTDSALYAGRGRLAATDARIALRLWREAAGGDAAEARAMRPLLLHLAAIQRDLALREHRCPGRSRSRKRQVFGRLQRARLYLEGHSDRVVRIGELAALTNFSSWYFSKTFQSLYEESPQSASARLRLERAAELLLGTDMMIGEVAAACGFDNCCSFARAFRARYGVSATRYRAHAPHVPTDSAKSGGGRGKAVERTGT